MGVEGKIEPLDRLIDESRGISYGIVQPGAHDPNGTPIIRVTDVRDGRINAGSPLKVKDEIANKYRRTTLRGGELLLTLVGTVGELAIVPPSMAGWNTARAVAVIPVLDDPGATWVKYALEAGPAREYIRSRLNTTVQATLNLRDVSEFPVPLPGRSYRQFVIDVLEPIDEKIGINRQIDETLEQMAQAIFKSWFIDFDPVVYNAVQAGNPVPERFEATAARYRDNTGIQPVPNETLSLFPDSFENSELGEIPVGWSSEELAQVAKLRTNSVQPVKYPDRLWEHYSIPAFDEAKSPRLELGETIKSGKYKVPRDAVLASKLNPQFPRVWLPDVEDEKVAICSTEFMPFISAMKGARAYIYELLKSDFMQQEITHRVSGSTGSRQRVRPKDVAKIKIINPDCSVVAAFCELVEPMHQKVLVNRRQSEVLSAIRDALLPKLISGELRTPDGNALSAEAMG